MVLALIIEDEVDLCRLMQITLKRMDIESMVAYDVTTAMDLLASHQFDFCLTDLRLPDGSGLDIVKLIAKDHPTTPVAVITAHGSTDLAIEALKVGAFDFVNKPLELPRLRQLVENAVKAGSDAQQQSKDKPDLFANKLIGNSAPIIQLKKTIQKLARSQAPVFLWGESGTGKEVVAKLIHDLSPRSTANFVPVNCGAIPSELMESEFFGHKKGSFTGATADKEGLFQQANGGTLFLDEVADLPLSMQVKLLRAIQEKKIRPIGGTKELSVDIRLLSATHKNLASLVESGEFRQDLYYRINVIEVKLPNLNERRDDVPLLAKHFLQLIAEDWQLEQTPRLSEDAIQALLVHSYSGNVRELRNILERAIILSDGIQIDTPHLNLQSTTSSTTPCMPIHPTVSHAPSNHSDTLDEPTENLVPLLVVDHQSMLQPVTSTRQTTAKPTAPSSYGGGNFEYHVTINPFIALPKPTKPDNIIQTLPPMSARIMKWSVVASPTPSVSTPRVSTFNDSSTDTGMFDSPEPLPPEGLEEYLLNQERRLIITALNQSGWNKTQAAKLLNTTFRSLRYRMKKLQIDNDE